MNDLMGKCNRTQLSGTTYSPYHKAFYNRTGVLVMLLHISVFVGPQIQGGGGIQGGRDLPAQIQGGRIFYNGVPL